METTEPTREIKKEKTPDELGWRRGLTDVRKEHGFVRLHVEGRIPPELAGTLYRNGTGLFSVFGRPYTHLFDGDGAVSAVRFRNGAAEGAVRIMETPGRLEEQRRHKAYYGGFGTRAPGFFNPWHTVLQLRGRGKNPSNTSVLAWAGRTFATCEAGKPFEFDPNDLTSIGETDLDGVVPRVFSAHPHRVAANGYIYNVGARLGKDPLLDLFALRPDGSAGRIATLPLPFVTMVHDFAATERHLVILVAPLRAAVHSLLLGRSFAESLRWEPQHGTEVIIVPLDAPASPIRFHIDPFWVFHFANAYEQGDEIVLDLVRYRDWASAHDNVARLFDAGSFDDADGYLGRARIDRRRRTFEFTPLRDRTGEFPRIAPSVDAREHRTVYCAEHSSKRAAQYFAFDTLARIDMETGAMDEYRFPAGHYPSEGVLAPRSERSETDGWLLSLVYDSTSHTSYWAVFDAARLGDGPIARAHLDHHVPFTLHGAWVPLTP